MEFHACPGGRTKAYPVNTKRVSTGDPVIRIERQKFLKRFLLSPIEYITLIFCDDKREAGNFCWKAAKFDTSEIGDRNFGPPIRFTATFVDLGFDRPHFLISNNEEISRTAGGVEHPNAGNALP